MKKIHCLVLCTLLAPALPTLAGEFDVDALRDRQVTHNDDGSVTVERSLERTITNLETGATRTLLRDGTVTRSEDAADWSRTQTRTGPDGRTLSSEASGSAARGDGERSYERTRSVTDSETGKTATRTSSGTLTRTEDGREWSRESTATGPNGGERTRSREGSIVRNEDGTRTRSDSQTRTATRPGGDTRSRTRDRTQTTDRAPRQRTSDRSDRRVRSRGAASRRGGGRSRAGRH